MVATTVDIDIDCPVSVFSDDLHLDSSEYSLAMQHSPSVLTFSGAFSTSDIQLIDSLTVVTTLSEVYCVLLLRQALFGQCFYLYYSPIIVFSFTHSFSLFSGILVYEYSSLIFQCGIERH